MIYGDIGTSPLYVYSSTFTSPPSYDDLLGALSLIIWSLTLIVTVKYVVIVLCADDEGEGGTFALYSLITRYVSSSPLPFFSTPELLTDVCVGQYHAAQSSGTKRGKDRKTHDTGYEGAKHEVQEASGKQFGVQEYDQGYGRDGSFTGYCWWVFSMLLEWPVLILFGE